jgi:hypothetical protein
MQDPNNIEARAMDSNTNNQILKSSKDSIGKTNFKRK